MHGNLPARGSRAISASDRFVVERSQGDKNVVAKTSTDKSVGSDENWFSDAAIALLGKDKPGTALDCVTGLRFGERNCQRYAGGDVKPPGYFIRELLRTPHGRQWLAAIMDGSDVPWWQDVQRAERITAAIDAVD